MLLATCSFSVHILDVVGLKTARIFTSTKLGRLSEAKATDMLFFALSFRYSER